MIREKERQGKLKSRKGCQGEGDVKECSREEVEKGTL